MKTRGRNRIIAAAMGALSIAAFFVLVPAEETPRLLLGDVDDITLYGGSVARYSAESANKATEAAGAIEQRMPGWTVEVDDNHVTVGVPRLSTEAAERVLRRVIRGGMLSFRPVENETAVSRELFKLAEEGGLGAGVDQWVHNETGRQFRDEFAHAPDCEELAALLARSTVQPDPGHQVVYERYDVPEDGQQRCRTYVVSAPIITASDISRAHVAWNQYSLAPEILLSLTADRAQRFAEFTRNNAGQKLAIVLDDQVQSAPVIQSEIPGGEVQISMGSGSPDELEIEAQALADTLGYAPITGALEPNGITTVGPTLSPRRLQGARLVFAAMIGAAIAGLVLLLMWLLPSPTTPAQPVAPAEIDETDARPWIALALTVVGFALIGLSSYVPIPTLNPDEMAGLLGVDQPLPSLFSPGITPVLVAFILVEIAAVAVPRWRPLRIGGPAARARLARPVVALTIVLALGQGYAIALIYASVPMGSSLLVGPLPILTTTLSLAASPLIYVLIATGISRWGLINGFSALIGFSCAAELCDWAKRLLGEGLSIGEVTPLAVGILCVALLLAALGTWRFLRARSGTGSESFRLPTCGILPLSDAAAIVSVLAVLGSLGLVIPLWLYEVLIPTTNLSLGIDLALVVVFGAIYSWLMSRPRPLISGGPQLADRSGIERQFIRAAATSIGFVAALWLIRAVMLKSVPFAMFDVVTVAIGVAIWLDLVDEWRARRRAPDLIEVWSVHRMQAVDVVASAIRGEGIAVHTRGVSHRMLLLFFGPFVPVSIMVPRADAERARQIAASTLGIESGSAADSAVSAS